MTRIQPNAVKRFDVPAVADLQIERGEDRFDTLATVTVGEFSADLKRWVFDDPDNPGLTIEYHTDILTPNDMFLGYAPNDEVVLATADVSRLQDFSQVVFAAATGLQLFKITEDGDD